MNQYIEVGVFPNVAGVYRVDYVLPGATSSTPTITDMTPETYWQALANTVVDFETIKAERNAALAALAPTEQQLAITFPPNVWDYPREIIPFLNTRANLLAAKSTQMEHYTSVNAEYEIARARLFYLVNWRPFLGRQPHVIVDIDGFSTLRRISLRANGELEVAVYLREQESTLGELG
jgi:hypothetical protein